MHRTKQWMISGLAGVALAVLATGDAAAEPDTVLYDNLPPLTLPTVDKDTLAMGSSLRVVGGSLELTGAGVAGDNEEFGDTESLNYSLVVDTRYFRSLEKTTYGYSAIVEASESLNRQSVQGGGRYNNSLVLDAVQELRFYLMPEREFFVYGGGDLDLQLLTTKVTGEFSSDADSLAQGQIGVSMGIGVGRVLAIDPIVRLRRMQQVLQQERLIEGDIPQDVGNTIIGSWYALRNEIGRYQQLAYTMKALSDAGMLRESPNLRATYKAISILADPLIFDRRRGSQARLGLGLVKPYVGFDDGASADPASLAVVGSAQRETPMGTDRQLSMRAKMFIDLGDSEQTSRPWSVRGFLTYTKAFYAPTYDPIGSLSFTAEAGLSGLRVGDFEGPRAGADITGNVTYSRILNQGSVTTLGGSLNVRNDGVFTLGLSVGVTWGIASRFYTPYAGTSW